MIKSEEKYKDTNVIYISSPSYSSSTLLSYLISLHPDVGTIGERKAFWRKMFVANPKGSLDCSCGQKFKDCSYWQSLKSAVMNNIKEHVWRANFSGFHLYQNRLLDRLAVKVCKEYAARDRIQGLPPIIKKRFQDILEANFVLIQHVFRQSKARVFLDSSKNPYHAVYLNTHPKLRVKVVRLYRDGRALLYSVLRRDPNQSVETACRNWVYFIKTQDKILNSWGENILRIQYEKLCLRPESMRTEIFKFAGLNPELAGRTDVVPYEQHIMGNNEMRLSGFSGISNKEQWREKLSQMQLDIFNDIAGDTNRSLGYS